MNSVFNPTKKLLEKSNNAKINFLRKNITETPPLNRGTATRPFIFIIFFHPATRMDS